MLEISKSRQVAAMTTLTLQESRLSPKIGSVLDYSQPFGSGIRMHDGNLARSRKSAFLPLVERMSADKLRRLAMAACTCLEASRRRTVQLRDRGKGTLGNVAPLDRVLLSRNRSRQHEISEDE